MKRLALALLLMALPVAAHAEEPPLVMTALDFIVDWPKLIGKKVTIADGKIGHADEYVMLLVTPSGIISLTAPWIDREDLRYLLRHCRELSGGTSCMIPVTGTVKGSSGGANLTNVDFDIPR